MLGLSLSKRLKNTLTWLLLKEVALKLSPGFSVWGDGTVHYLDCGSGYMGVYIVKNSSECTFNMSIIH